MRIYLAGAYSRREEFLDYAAQLQALGHEVTSRWLWLERKPLTREEIAALDVADLGRSTCLLSFTHPKEVGPPSGGRHVEFGISWAERKRLIVVGHKENVFHHLPEVEFCVDWSDALKLLAPVTA